MIVVYKTLSEFDSLEGAWNNLFSHSECATPFQSFSFCRSAIPLLSGSPHIIAWFRKDSLQTIFPLFLDSSGTLRFINDKHADFCGPIVSKGFEGDFHMCRELAEYIRENHDIKRIRLENMRYDLFQTSLQFQLKGSLLYDYARYSFFNIPKVGFGKSAIDAMSHLSTKEKYRLKNIASKVQKYCAQWKLFDAENSNDWPEDLIAALCKSMIDSGIRKKKYLNKEYLSFIKDLYESGALVVFATYIQERPVACNLFLKNGEEYIDWMAFYTEPSYNTWNLLQFISWLSETDGGKINFARGIYMYKMHNFRPILRNLNRIRYSKSVFGKIIDIFDCLISEIKRMYR